MASVAGLVEQARAFLPELVGRRRRGEVAPVKPLLALVDSPVMRALPNLVRPLADLVEQRIVPQVVGAHRDEGGCGASAMRAEAEAFAALALDAHAAELVGHLDAMLGRGLEVQTILIDVLAPAARRLGVMWEQDDCDFVDVTMGLWRLQEVVRELAGRVPPRAREQGDAWRALFSPMPGDQHNFGSVIAEDVFRRAGWVTQLLVDGAQGALLNAVATAHIDVVGLTVSTDTHSERLSSLILAIRSVSRNPRLCILLGGRVLTDDPQLALRVGADGTAPDAQAAVHLAVQLVTANACREVFPS